YLSCSAVIVALLGGCWRLVHETIHRQVSMQGSVLLSTAPGSAREEPASRAAQLRSAQAASSGQACPPQASSSRLPGCSLGACTHRSRHDSSSRPATAVEYSSSAR